MGVTAVVAIAVGACAHVPPEGLSRKAVVRSAPSKWYDGSYVEYFDAYGPVRTIRLLKSDKVNVERTLLFNEHGRLVRQENQDNKGILQIRFAYLENGRLQQVKSFVNGSEYRLSQYLYTADDNYTADNKYTVNNKALQKIRYLDYASGRQKHTQHKIQPLDDDGWFAIEKPVEQIELASYKQFDREGRLVWSSQSGFNHGPGRLFYIAVNDAISNARVIEENTPHMRGTGGYGYEYDAQGRLSKVTSFNGNDNMTYHTTTYRYNEQGLLQRETQVFAGRSLFNESLNRPMNRTVDYRYHNTDEYGNWTHRIVVIGEGSRQIRFDEKRYITYYATDNERASMK